MGDSNSAVVMLCTGLLFGAGNAGAQPFSSRPVRVLNTPEVKARFVSAGSETVAGTPEALAAMMTSDMATMGRLIQALGISAC